MLGQRRLTRLRLLSTASLVLTVGVATAVSALPEDPGRAGRSGPAGTPDDDSTWGVPSATVTLITGDRVDLHGEVNGQPMVSVTDADGNPTGGYGIHHTEDGVRVIPHSVTGLVPDVLDPDLFNVSKLVEMGYDDEQSEVLPLLVQTAGTSHTTAASLLDGDVHLDSIDAIAGDLSKQEGPQLLDGLSEASDLNAGDVTRVWLDGIVEPTALDHYLDQIEAPQAWDLGLDGEGVTIAVLDTGVDPEHPDLSGQVAASQNFTDAHDAIDRHGHGTHVASLAAGSGAGNDGQRQGIAPGAEILAGKVLGDTGEGQESWVIAGMEWAVEQGADVVNLSLSGEPDGQNPVDQALESLSAESDTLFVAAAGNSGGSTTGSYSIGTPGTSPSALTVGAVTDEGVVASFSSRGPTWGTYLLKPDLVAPGVEILGARAGAGGTDDLYTPMSGTSMSSPIVAGAAALLLEQHPDWTAEQVKSRLMSTTDGDTWYDAWTYGAGTLNLEEATTNHLTTSRAHLDFAVVPWPHEGSIEDTTTVTNHGDAETTVDLAGTLATQLATPAPDGAISVSPETATLAPGDSVDVTVSINLELLWVAPWQGILTIDDADDETGLRIPIGAYLEPESYQLDLQVLDANGDPWDPSAGVGQPGADPSIPIFNGRTGGFIRLHPDENGQVTARVPMGEWMVLARVYTPGTDGNPGTITVAGTPGLSVEEDTSYVIDARAGEVLHTATVAGHQTAAEHVVPFIYSRFADSRGYGEVVYYDPQAVANAQVRYTPTRPVAHGTFEALTRWWLEPTAPPVGAHGADAYDLVSLQSGLNPDLTPELTAEDVVTRPRVEQVFHPIGTTTDYEVASITPMGQINAGFGIATPVSAPSTREVLMAGPEGQPRSECLQGGIGWGRLCDDGLPLQDGEALTRHFGETMHPVVHAAWQSDDTIYASTGISDGVHQGSVRPEAVQHSRLELQDETGSTLGAVAGTYGYFRGIEHSGRFRLVHDLELVPGMASSVTRAHTEWEFSSRPPGPDDGYGVPPTILSLDYGFDLDLEGAADQGPTRMNVEVSPSVGSEPAQRIEEVEIAVSADDGRSWHDLRARRTGDTSFQAPLTSPVARGADHLSFRVSATDAAGNSIEQTTERLLTLR